MKKIFYAIILFTSFLALKSFDYSNAQDRSSLGIAPKLAEQQINKIPYSPSSLPDILVSTGYCADALLSTFYTVPVPAWNPLTAIGPLVNTIYGYTYVNGSLWGIRPPFTLVSIFDTVSRQISGVASGYNIATLAYKQPNGPMYIGATNLASSLLYMVNLSTGAATLVGAITNCPGLIVFAMNCPGDLYGIDIVSDNLVKINTSTGAGTIVGPIGFNANYAGGMAFDLPTGILYVLASNTTIGSTQVRSINLITGGSILITTWPGHEMTTLGILAPCPPLPSCDMSTGPFVNLPDSFVTWHSYYIKAKITNVGTAAQTNIPVKFFVNGGQYGSTQTIPSLAPGAFDTNRIFNWTPVENVSTVLKICTALGCDTLRGNDTVTTTVNVGSQIIFCDGFSTLSNWTITNNGGTCVWGVRPQRGYQMPPAAVGNCFSADADLCGPGTTMNTTATLTTPLNCSNLYNVCCEFDNDFYILGPDQAKMDISTNGGNTWINKFTWTTNHRASHDSIVLPEAIGKPNVKIRLTYVAPGWDWWWAMDNFCVTAVFAEAVESNKNQVPQHYLLSQNYPNPFNPSTVITYQLPKSGNVKLVVFDVLGREVKTLVNEYKHAGSYEVTFDGTAFSSGLYFYRISATGGSGAFTDVKKMLMIK